MSQTNKLDGDIEVRASTNPSHLGDGNIIVSVAPTLGNHLTNKTYVDSIASGFSQYDAIVVVGGGTGKYALISDAVADGKTNIFVNSGSYTETSAIVFSSSVLITGEKAANTIITFEGLTTPAFSADGTGGIVESGGTLSITNGTSAVVGIGTTFTNLSAGNIIQLGGAFYTILTITDNLNLTISETYRGKTLTNVSYIAFPVITTIRIKGLTILNSSGTPSISNAFSFTGINRLLLEEMAIIGFVNNIDIDTCNTVLLRLILSRTSTGAGIIMTSVYNSDIVECGTVNNTGNGLTITDCFNLIVDESFSFNNGERGVDIGGNSLVINFTNSIIQYNVSDGLRTSNPTTNVLIDQCNINNNNNGINFGGTNNSITGCIITNNTLRGILVGDNGIIMSNQIANNGTVGLEMTSDSNNSMQNTVHDNGSDGISISGNTQNNAITGNTIYDNGANGINISGPASGNNVISSNVIQNNTTNGLRIRSDDNVISSNRILDNDVGVLVENTSNDTIVSINNLTGNTSANFTDNGTATSATGNKS